MSEEYNVNLESLGCKLKPNVFTLDHIKSLYQICVREIIHNDFNTWTIKKITGCLELSCDPAQKINLQHNIKQQFIK